MFEKGQIYREYADKDYGDIIRWQVTAVGKPNAVVSAVVTNCATLQEKVVTASAASTFTWQCELLDETNRISYPSFTAASS